jgi:uncharacterized protein
MERREVLKAAVAACLSSGGMPLALLNAGAATKRNVLYFTRSAGFEHSVVQRHGSELSHSDKNLIQMGQRSGFDVECSKDGRIFDGNLDRYDAIVFYTSGDLTAPAKDGSPPMTQTGKQRLLDAIAAGKGFVGIHSATDTFNSKAQVDPYIAMLGGEFLTHGDQQEASLLATSAFLAKNIGVPGEGLSFTDEWYTFKNFAKDLHVILAQETQFMKGDAYRRPDYPASWVRGHGTGRVFYTSLGHREDVWTNPFFHAIVQGGLAWAMGLFDFDVKPNIEAATPGLQEIKS